eukprot:gene6166-6007_t
MLKLCSDSKDRALPHEIPLSAGRPTILGRVLGWVRIASQDLNVDVALCSQRSGAQVSRAHCVLEPGRGCWYVRDFASKNGTWLSCPSANTTSRLVPHNPFVIKHNDILIIGAQDSEIRYRLLASADPAQRASPEVRPPSTS